MWYWESATNTWDYFRYKQYSWCTNLISTAAESMPNTVTTIWNWFRWEQYSSCTWLTSIQNEMLPNSVTTIWVRFRSSQYASCKWLTYAVEEELPSSVTSIWTYFRATQYAQCTSLTQIKWWKDLSIWAWYYRYRNFNGCSANKTIKVLSDVWYASYANDTLAASYVTSVSVPSAYLNNFKNTSNRPRVNIDDSKFVWY